LIRKCIHTNINLMTEVALLFIHFRNQFFLFNDVPNNLFADSKTVHVLKFLDFYECTISNGCTISSISL